MPLPPVQTVSQSEIYVSGDITIHESAVIAPGTILQAAPNSRIVIEAGACIGMGVILNAYGGEIEIQSGAVIGAGVLIIGQGSIGQNACIGATTTIFNMSVEAMTVILSGSLLGDNPHDRSEEKTSQAVSSAPATPESALNELPTEEETVIAAEPSLVTDEDLKKSSVVGQVYINQLLVTLFPERRMSDGTNSNNS